MNDHKQQISGFEETAALAPAGTSIATVPAHVPAASSPEIKSLLALAVSAVVVAALYFAQDVLIEITLAVLLSFVLAPLVNLLGRIGLWRAPAVALSILVALSVLGLLGMMLGSQAATLAADAPRYAQTIEQKVRGLEVFAAARLASITREFGQLRTPPPAPGPAPKPGTPTTRLGAGTPAAPVLVELAPEDRSPLMVARTILAPVLGPLETMIIVLVVAIFILLEKEDLRDRFIRLFGSADLHRTTLAMDDAAERLSRYFLSQLAVNAAFGLVIAIGLWAIGIPSPALWGVLAGALRFAPYVGPVLAALAPLALAAAMAPGWATTAYVALLFIIVEPLTGYVVEPLLYGHSTGLSPISIIVAAVFWTWIWGPIGLILSTPLTLCLVVMGRHVKSLEFFDVLLGDRPALSPVNRFYQRMLANDPDEVLDLAETLLSGRSLVDYYDEVVLPGLKLAAEDEARGTITRDRSIQMTRGMLAVVADLEKHAAAKAGSTPSATVSGRVACISGRGPFDDVVSAMLAQLLHRRGAEARQVPYDAVSRDRIAHLDLAGVGVIALSYLELTGSPAHLRYLIGRLRQRAPDATLVIGLWPEGESALSDAGVQHALGGDRYASSIKEAIDAVAAALVAAPSRDGVAAPQQPKS